MKMSDLVRLDATASTATAAAKGNRIQQANPFFRDLCAIMKNNEFKRFYDEYFQSWNDVECMIFYMKLYSTIEYEFEQRYHTAIGDDLMSYTLHEIMSTPELRKTAFALFKSYEKDLTISQSKPLRSLLTFVTETH